MSDFLSIAAITTTLRDLLFNELNGDVAGISVTTRPLDKARSSNTGNQINLFLYHIVPSETWRNMDIPWRVRPGETAPPILPLHLYYLLTAYYGENEDNIDTTTNANQLLGSHRLLGRSMSILHDHNILEPAVIRASLPAPEQLSHPFDSMENVRITMEPLSLDDISKIWAGFQTEYRMSAAFEVSTVLIESRRPQTSPLPVLTIGENDSGVIAQPSLIPPYPTLESIQFPDNNPAARAGDLLTFQGHHLQADAVNAAFTHTLLEDPLEVAALPNGTSTGFQVQLPNTPAAWPVGIYSAAATITLAGEPDRTTNTLPFALAPAITNIAPNPAPRAPDDSVTLTITCSPRIRPGQKASLLIGSMEIQAQPVSSQTSTLTFNIPDAPVGDHFLRLRVDGLDSMLVDRSVTPPVFNPSQQVRITE